MAAGAPGNDGPDTLPAPALTKWEHLPITTTVRTGTSAHLRGTLSATPTPCATGPQAGQASLARAEQAKRQMRFCPLRATVRGRGTAQTCVLCMWRAALLGWVRACIQGRSQGMPTTCGAKICCIKSIAVRIDASRRDTREYMPRGACKGQAGVQLMLTLACVGGRGMRTTQPPSPSYAPTEGSRQPGGGGERPAHGTSAGPKEPWEMSQGPWHPGQGAAGALPLPASCRLPPLQASTAVRMACACGGAPRSKFKEGGRHLIGFCLDRGGPWRATGMNGAVLGGGGGPMASAAMVPTAATRGLPGEA